jgi:hypothetical protein
VPEALEYPSEAQLYGGILQDLGRIEAPVTRRPGFGVVAALLHARLRVRDLGAMQRPGRCEASFPVHPGQYTVRIPVSDTVTWAHAETKRLWLRTSGMEARHIADMPAS